MAIDMVANSTQLGGLGRTAVQAADWLLDLVFPPMCANCGRVDARFCAACRDELAGCPVEIRHYSVGGLDGVCATGKQIGVLGEAVKAFKYESATDLRDPLAERLRVAIRAQAWALDAVVPVPLHADRLLERGYNQSALLGARLAQTLGVRYAPGLLRRIRSTGQQARLSGSERQRNVAGAFAADPSVRDLSVLLIDDVVTTGATLGECAAALRAWNAAGVYAIAVSHA